MSRIINLRKLIFILKLSPTILKALAMAKLLKFKWHASKLPLIQPSFINHRKIVFIHGVGNGKLKLEIRRSLDRDYPQLKYQDASFQEYGYGATMVILPRPKIHS
jgi:hypothetical protein